MLTDLADIRNFGNTLIEIRANGQTEMMVRRAALLHKMYEDAMKGKVSMQRFLYAEFGRNDEQLAEARLQYQHLMTKWVIENPDFHGLDAKNIPFEVRMEIAGLETTLNHYYPEQYPSHGPLASKDDSDVSDG